MSETVEQVSELTINDFYRQLSRRVSDYNAKLLIHTVKVGAGLTQEDHMTKLKMEDAKNICLELIKKGGPAFQVGKAMYSHVQ